MCQVQKIKQAEPVYGRGLIASLAPTVFSNSIMFCAPEAWEIVKSRFPQMPRQTIVPETMEQHLLESQIRDLPSCDFVFGLGGGSACDAAKMYAYRKGAELILIPSILSVDAPFTKAIGVRVNQRVRYIGEIFPKHLLIDFDLLQRAPARLNRAGAGDILSIYTALYDWRLAADRVGERFDPDIAEQSKNLLERLFDQAASIRETTEAGLKLLSDLYYGEVNLCERNGNSRPEEGSEHYFAYCLESITGHKYLHGELIALSVLITSLFQGQPTKPVLDFLKTAGLEYRPSEIGVTFPEIEQTLLALPRYLEEESQLLFGIFHHRTMNEKEAREIIRRLEDCIDNSFS